MVVSCRRNACFLRKRSFRVHESTILHPGSALGGPKGRSEKVPGPPQGAGGVPGDPQWDLEEKWMKREGAENDEFITNSDENANSPLRAFASDPSKPSCLAAKRKIRGPEWAQLRV